MVYVWRLVCSRHSFAETYSLPIQLDGFDLVPLTPLQAVHEAVAIEKYRFRISLANSLTYHLQTFIGYAGENKREGKVSSLECMLADFFPQNYLLYPLLFFFLKS